MHVRKRVAALVAVIAAAAVAVPVASARTPITPLTPAALDQLLSLGPPGCPSWYGTPNPAIGCTPYWLFTYVSILRVYDTPGWPFQVHAH
jgi:hypothetical protein